MGRKTNGWEIDNEEPMDDLMNVYDEIVQRGDKSWKGMEK